MMPSQDPLLSPEELAVLQDKTFMPLKYSVSKKMETLLSNLRATLSQELNHTQLAVPETLRKSDGKISRGENYHTYAYRVLDYPSTFDKQDIFSFRTLILWGHHIGFHLLLTGKFKSLYQTRLLENREQAPIDCFLSQADIPWHWLPGENRHLSFSGMDETDIQTVFAARKFIKISVYLPLGEYAAIPTRGLEFWQQWAEVLFGEPA